MNNACGAGVAPATMVPQGHPPATLTRRRHALEPSGWLAGGITPSTFLPIYHHDRLPHHMSTAGDGSGTREAATATPTAPGVPVLQSTFTECTPEKCTIWPWPPTESCMHEAADVNGLVQVTTIGQGPAARFRRRGVLVGYQETK